MVKRPSCPCKDCVPPKRYPGCHSEENCAEWAVYQADKKALESVVKPKIRSEQDYASFVSRQRQRAFKEIDRRRK